MAKIKSFNEEVESLTINDDSQLENANALAKKCNKLIKEVKASHKDEIAKYHKLHKEAKAKEKQALEPLEKANKVLKSAIADYMKIVEQRKLEIAQQQEEEKVMFGEIITTDIEPELGGTHVRKVWKAKIVDESKVPVSFKNHMIRPVDMKALNEIAKFSQGTEKVEGVEFYQEDVLVVR